MMSYFGRRHDGEEEHSDARERFVDQLSAQISRSSVSASISFDHRPQAGSRDSRVSCACSADAAHSIPPPRSSCKHLEAFNMVDVLFEMN